MDTETTNSVGGEDNAQANLADEAGVEALAVDKENEPELDADGNPIEPEPETEEIEHEGKKFAIPKALKPLMLMQADYTKKTQEVAEERRAVQAERQAMHQIGQAEFQAAANATAAQQRVAQWDAYAAQFGGWRAWAQQDPFAAQEADLDRKENERIAGAHLAQLQQLRGQREVAVQQDTAKRIDEGRQTLAKDIPGWSDDLKAKLISFAAGYGFSRDELDDLEADPRVAKVLHAAFTGSKSAEQSKKVQTIQQQQAVQPAATVRTTAAPPGKVDDRLGVDEWMRRRNAQTRKRA